MRGAWTVAVDEDAPPPPDLRPTRGVIAGILVAVLLGALLIAMAVSYAHLTTRIREACSETSAAAKLDLSGMVPLCRDFKEEPR